MPIVLSGSLELTGSVVATGNFTTTGNITAQTLVVQTITSSIVNITGSNIFGSQISNRQTFTGSLFITGSSANFSNQVCGLMGNFSCVGIGNVSPTQKLDISSGHIKFSDGYGLFYGTQTQIYASEAAKYARFDIAGTSGVMYLSSSGNVGIGTTTPSNISTYRVLEITGPNTSTGGMIRTNISDNSIIGKFYSNSTGIWISSETAHPLILETSNTERMRITSDGVVSINCNASFAKGAKLQILQSSSNTNAIDFKNSDATYGHIGTFANNLYLTQNYYYAGGQNNDSATYGQAAITMGVSNVAGDTSIDFSMSDPGATSPSSKMRLFSVGCGVLLVGTTTCTAEASLVLGAKGTNEGGQLVLQKGTSCSCTTHLDNYNDSFRVLVGTDTASNGVHFLVDHKTRNACFYGSLVQSPVLSYATQVSPPSPYTADLRLNITHSAWGGNYDSGTVYVEYQGRAYGTNQTTTAYGVITYRLSSNGTTVTDVSTVGVTASNVSITTDVATNYVLRITFGVSAAVDRASIFARTTNSFVNAISADTV